MKQPAINRTTDEYKGLTGFERQIEFIKSRQGINSQGYFNVLMLHFKPEKRTTNRGQTINFN